MTGKFPHRQIAILLTLTGAILVSTGSGQNTSTSVSGTPAKPEIVPLEPNVWVERTMTEDNRYHYFEIDVTEGQAFEVEVGPKRVPFQLSVWGPKNERFAGQGNDLPAYVDDVYSTSINPDLEFEPLIVVADTAGKYRVRAVSVGPWGTYSIRSTGPRPVRPHDRAYMEAGRLRFEIGAAAAGRRSRESVSAHFERQIALYEGVGDRLRVAVARREHAGAFHSMGEYQKSIAAMVQARDYFVNAGLVREAMAAFKCQAYELLGDFQSTIGCYQSRLDLSRQVRDKQSEASALLGLGVIYHRLADEERARLSYSESLKVIRSLDPRTEESWHTEMLLFTNFGNLARGMNGGEVPIEFFPEKKKEDFEAALPFLFRAVEICKQNNFGFIQFNYRQIGNTLAELGRFEEAKGYIEQAIEINVKDNDDIVAAIARKELARVLIREGRKAEGARLLEEVLIKLKGSHSEVRDIALWMHVAGKSDRAKELLRESLSVVKQRNLLPRQAKILYEMASVERDLGNFENSRRHIVEAIDIADSLRNRITNDEIQSVYFAAVRKYYDFYIELLMQAHQAQPEKRYDRTALEVAEKARSRTLNDLLIRSGLDVRTGVDPDLLASEKDLRTELAAKAAYENRLSLSGAAEPQITKARAEVAAAVEALENTQALIRHKSPAYAAITQPSTLATTDIQALLDSGTVLLEYFLGDRKSYLWVVKPDSVDSFVLPPRSEIEKQARAVHAAITARNSQTTSKTNALRSADDEMVAASTKLSELILKPAAAAIANKRIVVVPDGALHYVPFAALPLGEDISVAQRHETVVLPSASTIARLRADHSSRTKRSSSIAVFADPVFETMDVRNSPVARKARKKANAANYVATRDLDLAMESIGFKTPGLPRLLFSRREADAILAAAPKDSVMKRVDFRATKEAVFSSGLENYRVVHFATHGLLDSRNPALSGLVLSLLDEKGTDIDGFLRLQDIYNLKLNADLVVLSACQTALGKEVRGEGIVGLTRGFMYAGSPRVVATLWKVDDAATAAFMSLFYKKMLSEHMRPAAALREAQNEMMKQPRWRSPYYWAPFVLQGEWK